MAMSRKHYSTLAGILRRHLDAADTALERTTLASVTRQVAAMCTADNPAFQPARFYTVAGLTDDGFLPEYQELLR